jgi:amino acid adenylation domain-containing protein
MPDAPRPRVATSHGAFITASLPPAVTDALNLFSNAEAVTPFMTLLAVFHGLLHRYTAQETIVIGSPIAGRTDVSQEGIIGCFVNTLALRADITPSMNFRELLRQVRMTCLDAYDHQDLPFELLVEELQPVRDLSRTPVFQAAFVLQNLDVGEFDLPGITVTPVSVDNGTAKYELTMTAMPAADHYTFALEYNTDLFLEPTARGILQHFILLLRACLASPGEAIGRLALLDGAERTCIEAEWNRTSRPFPDGTTAHAWFTRVVAASPDAPATVWHGDVLSYEALNRYANRFANVLRGRRLGMEDVVGICLNRSPELIAGVLGIMKAGAAFLPLDPGYPPDRLMNMCEDARVRCILTTESLRSSIGFPRDLALTIDDPSTDMVNAPDDEPPAAGEPSGLAYVIFTSGSTGRPKGSMVHHRGLCNLAAAQHALFPLGPGSRVLQFASPSFDAAAWELVMTLLSGGTLVLEDREALMTGQGLRDVLIHQRVTTITIPPSALAVLPDGAYPELRTIVVAGERCPADLVERWGTGRQMVNAYGPTETTVCASWHQCSGTYRNGPPIGRPLPNVRLYILDRNGQSVPTGVPGELYIGGMGVARGYYGKPDLTAERFVPDPFGMHGERLYRSGDLCRFRHDGEIEFLGRRDAQVKVRGYRIEPGEIQSALGAHPSIAAAEVIVREDTPGDQRIVAYLVTRNGAEPEANELRDLLRRTLPAFMVPSAFVHLAALPLTPAGKVDVRALPAPRSACGKSEANEVLPVDPIEAELASICAELLGVPGMGVHDSFFELGGHSLLATRFIARIRDHFGVELPVRALFEDPTIAGVAMALRAVRTASGENLGRVQEALHLLENISEEEALQMLKSPVNTNG